ncbi:MAG: Lrp/AsnC family transcriptional regulator [Hyphomicrobiales bacterium]
MPISASDAALIALLRENGRASVADLARRLGVSRTTVQSRIAKLEKTGAILGYTVRVADERERGLVRAHMMVTLSPKHSAGVEAALRKVPEVRALYSVSGAFGLIVVVAANSVAELDRLIDRIGAFDGVERTTSAVVLSTRIDR